MLDFPKNGVAPVENANRTVRFGSFEADLHAGEVRKSGIRIKLQDQPFKVLQVLLERPGHLVTREELQSRIWPDENFGDFDHAVNVAVGKLRTALGDSADNPIFIETIPRRGYRFVATLESLEPPLDTAQVSAVQSATINSSSDQINNPSAGDRRRSAILAISALLIGGALLGLGIWFGRRTMPKYAPEFQRLTVRHGTVYSARFAPERHREIAARPQPAAWRHLRPDVKIFDAAISLSSPESAQIEGMLPEILIAAKGV